MVELGKDRRRDQISHAIAYGVLLGDDGGDAPRTQFSAAMVTRALPETARPAGDAGRAPLQIRKIGLEYQRAVSEQPDAVMAVETIHQFVACCRIERHARASWIGCDEGVVLLVLLVFCAAISCCRHQL
jgi:hypothetical protein